ncbi:hypothetical protein ACVWWR_008060 [Bradyrhizobium sp. LM3.2]
MTEAGAALLIADHDQRCETEALAALDDLGDAVDVDELVDELAVALFPAFTSAAALIASTTLFAFCHGFSSPSEAYASILKFC